MKAVHAYTPDELGLAAPAFAAVPEKPVRGPGGEGARGAKLFPSLKEAIAGSGLADGGTISFHHHFREGDKIVTLVVDALAEMGFKDLVLASSSLSDCHAPLIGHIRNGVIRKIYTSGMRGKLGQAISAGLMDEPVQIHSHGGRAHLIRSGEIRIDVAFLGVPCCDILGNANGVGGKSRCGSLGYAVVDAQHAKHVVLLTEEIAPYPNTPRSIRQDQVDAIVVVDEVGDPARIASGATRLTRNPRELLLARQTAEVVKKSGYLVDGFSLQMGTGGASLAVAPYLQGEMEKRGITAGFALGGITGHMVRLHELGLVKRLLDVQCFDGDATASLGRNPDHLEISANEYAGPSSKGASVTRLDVVILSALEVDVDFNVNVITGSDGVFRGASGGHSDTAAEAALAIIVAPLVRGRIPTVVDRVTTIVTPGSSIDVLVTDHGIAVNPGRPELEKRLREAGLPVTDVASLRARAVLLSGKAAPLPFDDRVVGVIRYRDGSVIDVVRRIGELPEAGRPARARPRQ